MDNVREKWKECRKTLTLDNRFILSCIVSAPNETPKYGVLDLADFQEEYYTIQELSSVLDTGVHIRGAEPDGTGISLLARFKTYHISKKCDEFLLYFLLINFIVRGERYVFREQNYARR